MQLQEYVVKGCRGYKDTASPVVYRPARDVDLRVIGSAGLHLDHMDLFAPNEHPGPCHVLPEIRHLVALRGKVVALMSASPGALGELRGLVHLRSILAILECIVLPDQVAVSRAHEAFTADGA